MEGEAPKVDYASTFLPLSSGWLKVYLEAMVEMRVECPLPFLYLSAACALGHMLARGHSRWTVLDRSVEVYPNINVLLLSPAGKCRRGEGTKLAMRIAKLAGCNVFEGKATPEGLADELADQPSTLLYSEELSTLISKREHSREIIPFLTKALLIGRGQMDWRTRGAGKRMSLGPFNLSFLGTTAPSWFLSTLPEEAYGGGFLSRLLVCHLTERDTFHVDVNAEGDYNEVLVGLAEGLAAIVDRMPIGRVRSSEEGAEWFTHFYEGNEVEVVEDERMEPHRNRRPANLLRLATIIAASDQHDRLEVQHYEAAHRVLMYLEPTIKAMYAGTDEAIHDVARAEQKVMARLRTQGGVMGHQEMVTFASRQVRGGMRQVRELLEGMVEQGKVEAVRPTFVGAKFWPPEQWRLVVKKRGK